MTDLKVQLDLEALTVRDYITIERSQNGGASFEDAAKVLDKITDVDVLDLRLTEMRELLEHLASELAASSNPASAEGN